jgi:hypothetical protein
MRGDDKMPATKTVKRQGRKDGRGNEQAKHEGMKLHLASRRGCFRAPPAAARTTRTEAVVGPLEPHESVLKAWHAVGIIARHTTSQPCLIYSKRSSQAHPSGFAAHQAQRSKASRHTMRTLLQRR